MSEIGFQTENDIEKVFRLNHHAPVAQKIADEVISRRFLGEGVEFFFKSDLTDPPSDFFMRIFWKKDLSPSRFHF